MNCFTPRRIRFLSTLAIAFAIVFSSTTVFAEENSTTELGSDVAFLEDKARQATWEDQVWSRAESAPVLGDWKSEISTYSTGSWSWRDGVICVTDSYASVSFFNNGHAGMIAVAPYYYATIEANPSDGVQIRYGDWPSKYSTGRIVQVGVLSTTEAQDQQAAQWACNRIGYPYQFGINRLGSRDAFYCSQLVYAAYKDVCGVDLNTIAWPGYIHPFELIDTSKTAIIYER